MSDEDQGRGFIRVDVWLGPRHLEILADAKAKFASTNATAIRAGLELLREKLGLDRQKPEELRKNY